MAPLEEVLLDTVREGPLGTSGKEGECRDRVVRALRGSRPEADIRDIRLISHPFNSGYKFLEEDSLEAFALPWTRGDQTRCFGPRGALHVGARLTRDYGAGRTDGLPLTFYRLRAGVRGAKRPEEFLQTDFKPCVLVSVHAWTKVATVHDPDTKPEDNIYLRLWEEIVLEEDEWEVFDSRHGEDA